MATNTSETPPSYDDKEKKLSKDDSANGGMLTDHDVETAEGASLKSSSDILALQDTDPVMNMKMHLVNNVSDGRRLLDSEGVACVRTTRAARASCVLPFW